MRARLEARADSLDHLREPIPVQPIQHEITEQVRNRQPQRDYRSAGEAQDFDLGFRVHYRRGKDGAVVRQDWGWCDDDVGARRREGCVDVAEDEDRGVGAPDYAGAEEGEDQHDAVQELVDGAC